MGETDKQHLPNQPAAAPLKDFTSMEDVKHHNAPIVERVEDDSQTETVYLIDGEVDADNPLVAEVRLTRILSGQENYSTGQNYLKTLFEDMIGPFDMHVAETEEEAVQTLQEWKAQS
jgi:hypothetical protein